MKKELLRNLANTIRGLSIDGIQKAKSGHPGLPMGMADVAAVLWSKFLQVNPKNPKWFNRDRFILSGGHGSMLLYSLLHLYGFDLSLDDLKSFRQWESRTPGHPEWDITPGVETTTGPLGQGLANAVGFALAEKSLAARYNREGWTVIDHFTYVMAGDGDLEEGISHEVCSFAGHNRLGKLILLYDNNKITIDGSTRLSYSEDVLKRFSAYGWHVQSVDGHDTDEIAKAIEAAKNVEDRPSLISCATIIGFGSPNKAGTAGVHGSPLGDMEIELTKATLGLPKDKKFYVPEELGIVAKQMIDEGKANEGFWEINFAGYKKVFPELGKELADLIAGNLPINKLKFPVFDAGDNMASRAASGKVLDSFVKDFPAILGGSADLTPSNKTYPNSETSFSPINPRGRYIHYGVREHGMAGIMNGMALHGGVVPYGGTFFVFADYMRPSMRMAALMGLQVIYVLTHDSIGLGEDGPTHQPVAQLASLRAMPNMVNIRPMDANEVSEAWKYALKRTDGPTTLVLSRQKLPTVDRKDKGIAAAKNLEKGGYILTQDKNYQVIIIASGSEVQVALEAKQILNGQGIKVRIVSMPSTDIFEMQSSAYQSRVLPKSKKKRVVVEAGSSFGWEKYATDKGVIISIDGFGASAPNTVLFEKFGFTAANVAKAAAQLV